MTQECLIAEFADRSSFETAIEVLRKGNFRQDDFSVVTTAEDVDDAVAPSAKTTTDDSPPAEETTGTSILVGGTLGGVLGTATMIGPLLLAGPIVGMAAGAVGGGLLSAVQSWGVRHDVALDYEQRVADGSRLIIVNGDELKVSEAERMMKTCDPTSLNRFKAD